jgi:hypothetical protein
MRKGMFIAAIVFLIMGLTSCSKDSSEGAGGAWTFKSNTYEGISGVGNAANATFTAVNTVSGSTYSNVVVTFPGTLPTDSGAYVVSYAGSPPAAKHVIINLTYATSDTTIYYGSTGGNGKNEKIYVTINKGQLEVSGQAIEMLNDSGGIDSAALTLDIRQTQ